MALEEPAGALGVSDRRPTLELRRHPVRGLVAGFSFGAGAALLLIAHGHAPFAALTPYVVPALCATAGMVLAIVAPARRPRRSVSRERGKLSRAPARRRADADGRPRRPAP